MSRFLCRPVPLDKQKSVSQKSDSAGGQTMGFSAADLELNYFIPYILKFNGS